MLVGSAVGLHWTRTMDIARNSNVPLFGGLDPFTSPPVAALELALLLAGASLLLYGDALVTLGRALLGRLPTRLAAGIVAACVIFGSAVKMGGPQGSTGDFLRPLPALAALALFHGVARRWERPGAGAILLVSLLATLTNFAPLFEGHRGAPPRARGAVRARARGEPVELPPLPAREHSGLPAAIGGRGRGAGRRDEAGASESRVHPLGEEPARERRGRLPPPRHRSRRRDVRHFQSRIPGRAPAVRSRHGRDEVSARGDRLDADRPVLRAGARGSRRPSPGFVGALPRVLTTTFTGRVRDARCPPSSRTCRRPRSSSGSRTKCPTGSTDTAARFSSRRPIPRAVSANAFRPSSCRLSRAPTADGGSSAAWASDSTTSTAYASATAK